MIADIIIVLIIVLFIIIGVKRGIARTILNIAGLFVTYIFASYLSDFLAQLAYDTFLKQTVANNINEFITTNGLDYAASNCLGALPDWANAIVSAVVSLFGGSCEQFVQSIDAQASIALSSSAEAIEKTVEVAAVAVFAMILLIVLFILIFIIVKKLIRLVLKVFKAPVLKQVNGLFGGVLGAAEGILCAWIAVNVFYTVAFLSAPELLTNALVNGRLYSLLCMA